jgi:hypothetical protein
MSPIFIELSKNYTSLIFLKVDVDEVAVRFLYCSLVSLGLGVLKSIGNKGISWHSSGRFPRDLHLKCISYVPL